MDIAGLVVITRDTYIEQDKFCTTWDEKGSGYRDFQIWMCFKFSNRDNRPCFGFAQDI